MLPASDSPFDLDAGSPQAICLPSKHMTTQLLQHSGDNTQSLVDIGNNIVGMLYSDRQAY